MGFDVYGMKPVINEDYPKRFYDILRKWGKGDHLDWTLKIPKEVTKEYFSIQDKFDDDNPGRYFRNNVWFWRPLWNFVCASCDDFLTDKDMSGGDTNDGYQISATKAKRIAARLRKALKDGVCTKIEEEYKERADAAREHNVKIEAKLEQITTDCREKHGDNLVPRDFPEPYKSQWDKAYSEKRWDDSYPFSVENIERFARFCEKSGGFEIC